MYYYSTYIYHFPLSLLVTDSLYFNTCNYFVLWNPPPIRATTHANYSFFISSTAAWSLPSVSITAVPIIHEIFFCMSQAHFEWFQSSWPLRYPSWPCTHIRHVIIFIISWIVTLPVGYIWCLFFFLLYLNCIINGLLDFDDSDIGFAVYNFRILFCCFVIHIL